MTSIPRYGDTAPPQRKTQASRRSWNELEEQQLLHCLKEMLANGWKADNAFRPGYLQALEVALNAILPNSKILAKHINSKITVWKKTYGQLLGMQGTSGFGWNDSGRQITVEDEVWDLYVKAHPDVANMRYKTYHYFDDWVEIFGRDRATGDGAESFEDIVEDLTRNTLEAKRKRKEPSTENEELLYSSPCVDLTTTDASDVAEDILKACPIYPGFNTPRTSKLTKKLKKEKIKKEKQQRMKKTPEVSGPDVYKPDMSQFLTAAKDTWADLTSKFAKEEDTYDDKAQKIIAALESIESLSEENRNFLSFKIMDNAKHTSLFLNSNPRNREIQAHMMLEGKMP